MHARRVLIGSVSIRDTFPGLFCRYLFRRWRFASLWLISQRLQGHSALEASRNRCGRHVNFDFSSHPKFHPAKQRSNFLFFEEVSSTHKSRRDEIFIDTRMLTFTAP